MICDTMTLLWRLKPLHYVENGLYPIWYAFNILAFREYIA